MYNILSCSGHFKDVWFKTSICCSLHISTYIVQVCGFQIACESFAQKSKFDKFQKTSIIFIQHNISSVALYIFHPELLILKISILSINVANYMIVQASNHDLEIIKQSAFYSHSFTIENLYNARTSCCHGSVGSLCRLSVNAVIVSL